MNLPDAGQNLSPELQELVSRLTTHSDPNAMGIQAKAASAAWWSTRSATTMCTMILVFGLITMLLSSLLAIKQVEKDTVLRIVVIPMAVMSAIFLVVAGYSDSQIAPAMGLLGTIVGYVLGASKGSTASNDGR